MIDIREMEEDDIELCQKFVERSHFFRSYGVSGTSMGILLRKAITDSASMINVALIEGNPVGFSLVLHKGAFGNSPYLRLLAIDDNFHRRGIGRRLMEQIEETYSKQRDIFLLVTESNKKARLFYEGLGYQCVGMLDDYIKKGVTECLYRKHIQPNNLI